MGIIIFQHWWFIQLFFSLGELLIKVSSTRGKQECLCFSNMSEKLC